MSGWPSDLHISSDLKLQPVIPKFHEPAHKAERHHKFSCNLVKGLGNCDCEGPECIWGGHNNLGNLMKTMGPGSCHDVLDNHFSFWNWLKYIGMGKALIQKYKAAIWERNVQVEGHRGLSTNLPVDLVAQWDLLCVEWENDTFPKSVENPFHVDGEFLSKKEVEKELEEEEEERKHKGGVVRHATSADKFLILGLELEESQRKVRTMAAKHTNKTLTESQDTSLMDQRNAWAPLRGIYLLGLLQYLADIHESNGLSLEDTDLNLEAIKLWLPSSVPADSQGSVCIEGLPDMEDRLWTVQCNDALQGIWHMLHLKLRMVQFKNKNTRGQQATGNRRLGS
ncbi:hypothetical protein ARMSODRAFT_987945 [Armillaria solidipes]|uniref:CxC2-like cysteine cluster KDZ transposase-associated domain-containing protein n=1 Tax=Armillaria solidipes TaxID=1076256 RepID=A0A2H3BVL7_9AGAR|nr:hypothetical protein ARMSODRAFT_987945 [Armillaria solidipes]